MAKQNIFDNETFFEGYKAIRNREGNANDLFEIPALFSLLPNLKGTSVLDLGCGFGEHCVEFVNRGASKVVGIDISEKMLEVAKKEHSNPAITYMLLPIEDIEEVEGKFDVVISSLAFHYVEDFEGVVRKIYDKLNTDGRFIFSQENPINTTYCGEIPRWTKDENGKKIYVNLANYAKEGERESEWFIEGIKKYHRMFSTIINTLTENGFIIEKMIEPIPTDEILERFPDQEDLFHKPDFLLIKAKKLISG